MRKNIILLVFLIIFTVVLSGCNDYKENRVQINIGENSNIVRREKEEKFYNITVPKILYDEISSLLTKNGRNLGLSEYVIEDDGSVTYKISADKKTQVISFIKKFSADSINSLKEEFPLIEEIKINGNFDYINIMVAKDKYIKSKLNDFFNKSAKYILLYTAFSEAQPKDSYTVGFSVLDMTDFSELEQYSRTVPEKATPQPKDDNTLIENPSAGQE